MNRPQLLLFVCLSILSIGTSRADIVYMKNGHRIVGHIVSDDANMYKVETGSTTFEISTTMIDRVVKYKHRDTSLVLLGDESVKQQDYEAARRYYERAQEITKSPETIQKRLDALDQIVLKQDDLAPVDEALKKGDYRLAADRCQALLEGRDGDKDAFATELRKKASHAYCKLAQQYFDSVRMEEALFDLRKSMDLDPYNAEAHGLAGMILARQGHYEQAHSELMLAQELDPGSETVLTGFKILGETAAGMKEIVGSSDTTRTYDTRELDQLLDASHTSGRNSAIQYATLAQRTRMTTPVKFDMNAITRRTVLDGVMPNARPLYTFRSTRALSVFLQAYNAGPGAAAMYNGNVPYTETVNYVERVAKAVEDISSGEIGPTPYDPLIEKYAVQFGFHPTLIKAIVKVESDFNPECVSTADARGLIQLVRVDWVDTMKRLEQSIDFDEFVCDPELNLMVGCHYLRWLVDNCLPKYFEEEFG